LKDSGSKLEQSFAGFGDRDHSPAPDRAPPPVFSQNERVTCLFAGADVVGILTGCPEVGKNGYFHALPETAKSLKNMGFRPEKRQIVFVDTGKMLTFALPKISDHG
jgi:hypothetical protein